MSRPTYVIRTAYGWSFVLNGIPAPANYLTRAIARERLAHHKAARTAYYYGEG